MAVAHGLNHDLIVAVILTGIGDPKSGDGSGKGGVFAHVGGPDQGIASARIGVGEGRGAKFGVLDEDPGF